MAVSEIENVTNPSGVRGLIRNWRRQHEAPQKTNPLGYLFIAPALILYLVFNIWPMVRGFLMAFTDYRFVYPDTKWAFNGFANFTKLFQDKKVIASFLITLKYAVIVIPVVVIIALMVAVLISRVRNGAGVYRWIVYLPSVLPLAVSFLMFKEMFGTKFGFVNSVLRGMGVVNPPEWFLSPSSALTTVGAAHIWILVGFPTLLFLIGIYNIGEELYEAGSLDGANGWQKLRYITLPLLKPTFALVLILLIPGIIAVTEPMLILTLGGPQDSTKTLGLNLYQIAFQKGDLRLGYASAISLTMSLGVSVIVAIIFWLSREKN